MNPERDQVVRIWKELRQSGKSEGINVPTAISDSWRRSAEYQVDPKKRTCDVILSTVQLEARLAENRVLVEQASASMEDLFRFTRGSGFIMALADSDGYILKKLGDDEVLEFVNSVNFVEGARWTEQIMGTNAIGTTLVARRPIQVFAYEHFSASSFFTTCSAAPIFDAHHNLMGVLDITGPYEYANLHTLGMVVAAARAIERQLVLFDSYQQSETDNIYKNIIMESVSDGILTLDNEWRITHANSLACQYLELPGEVYKGKTLAELLPFGNEAFLTTISGKKTLWNEPLVVRRSKDLAKIAVSCSPLSTGEGKEIGKLLVIQKMKQYRQMVKRALGAHASIDFEQIIGASNRLKETVHIARTAALTDSSVLLQGESGVGKEMFAQAIHRNSHRRQEPFYAINCASLPRELVSSELFGYEEGAFTGARRGGNPGKFELADQGTLFLDEIGDMPLDIQAVLLRVLEEGNLVRLGGREVTPVNVRIIAASNKNLAKEAKMGRFRSDLYYRLGVLVIEIPTLRDRKGDIPELVEHFIRVNSQRMNREITGIEDRALNLLFSYDWPGNVRELNNVIERAVTLNSGPILTAAELEPILSREQEERSKVGQQLKPLEDMEETMIRAYLKRFDGNRTRVAEEMGMARSSLYRKLEKYQIS